MKEKMRTVLVKTGNKVKYAAWRTKNILQDNSGMSVVELLLILVDILTT